VGPEGVEPPTTVAPEEVAPLAPEPVTPPEAPVGAPEEPASLGGGAVSVPQLTFIGPDFFNPPPPRGWLTLTPSLTLDFRTINTDFLGELVPGLTLSLQRPNYRVAAGYSFTWEFFDSRDVFSGLAPPQRFYLDGVYQVSPRLQLVFTDRFVVDQDTAVVSGVFVGREDSLRNTAALSIRWQATRRTVLQASAGQTHLEFGGATSENDSDTYRLRVGADHELTPRLRGLASVESALFAFQDESDAIDETLLLGLGYVFTPRLTGLLSAGPSVLFRDEEVRVRPAVAAQLTWRFRFGSLGAGYSQRFTSSSIGLTGRQSFFASLVARGVVRGLLVDLTPVYSMYTDVNDDSKTRTITLRLGATYQLAANIALIGHYTLFNQRTDGRTTDDENRVFLGLQYAFPINFY
jgi:predicted porin